MDGVCTLIERLETTREETLGCFALGEADLARTYAPGKWSIRYILHHLADSETVWYERIRRVLTLKDEFDKVAAENAHHLEQIRAALSGTPWPAA